MYGHEDELEEISRKACSDPCFTPEEREVIREMIRVYRGWMFAGKMTKAGVVILGLIAAGVASLGTFKELIQKWLG